MNTINFENVLDQMNIIFLGETPKRSRVRIRAKIVIESPPGEGKPTSQPVLKFLREMADRMWHSLHTGSNFNQLGSRRKNERLH